MCVCVFIVLETDRVAREKKKRDETSKDKIKQNTDIKGLIHLLFVLFFIERKRDRENQEDIQVKNTFFERVYLLGFF